MTDNTRTSIGIPAALRDGLKVVAAVKRSTLSKEVATALTGHLAQFAKENPDLAPQLRRIARQRE